MKQTPEFLAKCSMALCMALGASLAQASDYPNRPIKLIVPFPPGGVTDTLARVAATVLSQRVKQPVMVDNRPGGNTLIAGQAVVNSLPDGYTLLFSGGTSMSTVFNKKVPYELMTALKPVAPLYQGPYFLFVSNAVPASNLKQFVEYTKANPDKLHFASAGPPTMLAMEALKAAAGLDLVHVPYKGSAPLSTALLANEIEAAFESIVPNGAYAKAGKLKLLAHSGARRLADFPDVPTLSESGYPIVAGIIGGVWAPAATPQAVVEKLTAEFNAVVNSPEFKERVRSAGYEVLTGSAEDFRRTVQADIDFWRATAKSSNYVPQ